MKSSKTTLSKIGISIIASVLLSQNLAAADIANNALPAGGKFTHGSGSIKVNGKEMNITGNNTNHIIAWGGGFNIGKDAEVNFNTSHGRQASFLNLDYTNKASQILGKLNGNNHNIYLVNPSGVLIGQNASINANKFVASNIIDDTTLNSFKTQTKLVETFSPVFKPNKGNIVNLGSIRVREIVLIGNEVRNQAIIKENGKETIITGSFSGYDDKNPNNTTANSNNLDSLKLVGDKVTLVLDNVVAASGNKVTINANNVEISQSTSDIVLDKNLLNSVIIQNIDNTGTLDSSSIDKYASIKDITDWYYFANGWNNSKNDMRNVGAFRLINDIDFSKGNKICLQTNCDTQNGREGVDYFTFSGNYADPNGNNNYDDDTMVVGGVILADAAFTANFDGGGNALSNVSINIDIDTHDNLLAGIFGMTEEADIYNLAIKDIKISLYNDVDNYFEMGSLIGYARDTKIYDIKIMNVEMNSKTNNSNSTGQVMVGGFVGWLQSSNIGLNSVYGIIVNNVEIDIEYYSASPQLRVGSFVGFLKNVNISDVIFSGIIDLHTKIYKSGAGVATPGGSFNYAGGFIGELSGENYFNNIYLYFNPNSAIKTNTIEAGKFYGKLNGNTFFTNMNLYYFDTANPNSIADLLHSGNYYNQTINPSIPAQDKINLYTYTNSTNKRDEFNAKIKQTFGDNIVILGNDIEGWNYHFNPPLNNPTLPTLDMDNLFNKGGYFDSSSWLTKDDFNQSILDSILGKDNQGNSNLIFDLLTQDLESIRQSLDFLVSFLDGENDIKELFGDYYKVNDNIYGALNQDLTINLKFSNFIEALKQNKNINLAFLKDYRDKLNTYNQNKELYQSGGLPSLEQESLKKLLEEQYNELLNLEQIAKTNLESLQGLIKDSFKMDTNYTIFAKESLSPLNFKINIGSLNNFEDTQGNGDNNNRFTPPSEVQKIADLASKEAILILPAQEKQEAIVEDGKERGRLCIVSDNAKTNNPCMAITY